MSLNYIDLFAGAGGLSEGFTACGYHPIAHVEMDTDACMTLRTREAYYHLKSNGQEELFKQYLKGNIRREELYSYIPDEVLNTVINMTMSEETMPQLFKSINKLIKNQKVSQVDLIVGGPPCQAYSLVGRAVKGEKMKNDPRNYLYKLYLQVLERYKPKMFVFENVPGLLNANNGKYFADMKMAFEKAGYNLKYDVLNAKDFGVLQSRQRVILIGWKKTLGMQYPAFEQIKSNYKVKDLLLDLPKIKPGEENNCYRSKKINKYLSETGIRKKGDVLTWHIARPNIERDRKIYRKAITAWDKEKRRIKYTELPEELKTHQNTTAFLDRFKVVASDLQSSHTMMAHISKDGHYFIHPDYEQARSISVREAARIQSFPDDYYFEGARTAAFRQIGNAVPPLMAKGIAEKLKEQLESQNG